MVVARAVKRASRSISRIWGLFHLSGFQRYQLSGRYSLFGGLRYIYRVADNDFGALKVPLYLGGSLEQGGVWNKGADISLDSSFTAGSVYVGVESFLGPVFLGYGMAEGAMTSFICNWAVRSNNAELMPIC